MNPAILAQEIALQNKLLKEAIARFPQLESEDEEGYGLARRDSTASTDSDGASSVTSSSSKSSIQQTTLDTLLDILQRQESRLDLLEQFGKSIWRDSSNIPVFRGLNSKSVLPLDNHNPNFQGNNIDVNAWCDLILNHLNCSKSFNPELESKDLIKFIEDHLDLEPLKLIKTLLRRNRLLVRTNYPEEVPDLCQSDEGALEPDDRFLYDYPFKLYVLRFPRALLNMIRSKFDFEAAFGNVPSGIKYNSRIGEKQSYSLSPTWRGRIQLQPQDSLLRKPNHQSSNPLRAMTLAP